MGNTEWACNQSWALGASPFRSTSPQLPAFDNWHHDPQKSTSHCSLSAGGCLIFSLLNMAIQEPNTTIYLDASRLQTQRTVSFVAATQESPSAPTLWKTGP
jgi:hypothetical protein